MSAQSMLDQLLRQGLSLLQGQGQTTGSARQHLPPGRSAAGGSAGPAMNWGSFGAGAATGATATGALALLLGSKQARRVAGKAVKYGGIAAIGLMAYKAYDQWQTQQALQAKPAQPAPAASPALLADSHSPAALPAPRTVDRVGDGDREVHSRAILKAMIAAAKSDGHLDSRERSLLDGELARLAADHALRLWLDTELQRPLDPAEVAGIAQGDAGLGAEMYLVSLLVADDQSFMERAYLDELARQLGLAPGLKAQLEAQAAEA